MADENAQRTSGEDSKGGDNSSFQTITITENTVITKQSGGSGNSLQMVDSLH